MFANSNLAYARGRLIVLDYASLRAGGSGRPLNVNVPNGYALQPAITYSPSGPTSISSSTSTACRRRTASGRCATGR